tara:strand:- start:308 stop:790 length:483 start_codon:yes stop_codon:yes gene_type:complete
MKSLLKFLLEIFKIIINFITLEDIKKDNKELVRPFPVTTYQNKEINNVKWELSEIVVAMFLIKFDVEKMFGLTNNYVAQCIGRTEEATRKKGYRSISKGKKNDGSIEGSIMKVLDESSKEQVMRTFYRNLIVVAKARQTGVDDHFIDKLNELGESFLFTN